MKKIIHIQTIHNSEYGLLTCYGHICKETRHYISTMKKVSDFKHNHSDLIFLSSFFGTYPQSEFAPEIRDWKYFLCIKHSTLQMLLDSYNRGDFKSIASFPMQHRELAFALPVILKAYELTRSGKKNIFCIDFNKLPQKNYYFEIEREVFNILSEEFRN
ncbi:hypothetical protein [Helicobacter brantae]|uniref:Uncharacterized protein n=1 Tax=Helicobacter brantae TaxID=375927 RepID=A0A3D8J1S1_9HELI|nr:hypothetical protein [Helicobacter brantae]RDU71180.1 hypothetical protein CQA58_03440 [Helicobacter brantae]